MKRPCSSTIPDAVRISVSICSFTTGACDGSTDASSAGIDCRHVVSCADARNASNDIQTANKIVFLRFFLS
jgi:hypothetical protein